MLPENKMNYFVFVLILFLSQGVFGCTLTYNSSSNDIKRTMDAGFDWHNGWNFNQYDSVCNRLKNNNAGLHISGMIWEHKKDEYIASYVVSITDKKSELVSTDFGRNGLIVRSNYSNPNRIYIDLFDTINNDVDEWFASGNFDKSVKEFHKKKTLMKGL